MRLKRLQRASTHVNYAVATAFGILVYVTDPRWSPPRRITSDDDGAGACLASRDKADGGTGGSSRSRWPANDSVAEMTETPGIGTHSGAAGFQVAQGRDASVAALIRSLDDVVARLTGLSWVGFDVLRVTCAYGYIGIRELAHRSGMPGAPFELAVDFLVAQHLAAPVEFAPWASPGLAATAAGRRLVRYAGPAIGVQERRLLHRVSAIWSFGNLRPSVDVSRSDLDRRV